MEHERLKIEFRYIFNESSEVFGIKSIYDVLICTQYGKRGFSINECIGLVEQHKDIMNKLSVCGVGRSDEDIVNMISNVVNSGE